jgi:hypothetical protein
MKVKDFLKTSLIPGGCVTKRTQKLYRDSDVIQMQYRKSVLNSKTLAFFKRSTTIL